ncbi:MAG: response regulator transcription factor [Spirochaetales bacterium]|nr:response regulator transcription factor [Spirochaetales bacterium]
MMKKVVIIDDHPIVRQGFVLLINQEEDLEVVGEAEDAPGAVSVVREKSPDLALVDLSLKNSNGLELIKDLKVILPELIVLVVSLHDEEVYAERALRAGAKGFIMKAEATDNVMTAIREVLQGGVYLSNAMRSKILHSLSGGGGGREKNITELLSDREFEVFQLIGNGLNTRNIAHKLNLSIKTIETYKSHLKTKLNLQDATEMIQYAVEWVVKNNQYTS